MILYGQDLVKTLREHCDNAKERIWIATPFIGSIKDVKRIIGGTWMRSSIDTRILTDVEAGFIKKDTFDEFKNYNIEIHSLQSLHAKIYIVDDWCLLTSANLTGTAFSCRYEVGTELNDISKIEELFDCWWNLGTVVDKINHRQSREIVDYQDGGATKFGKKWNLPAYTNQDSATDKYLTECDKYREFALLYKEVTGRNKAMMNDGFSLLMEVDYMFNFLYLDHKDTPTKGVTDVIDRTPSQKKKLIEKYFKQTEKRYQTDPQKWRLDRVKLFQDLLSSNHIDNLTTEEVNNLCHNFHSFLSYQINIPRFINTNDLQTITKVWKELLHSGDINSKKIQMVQNMLKYFGPSSIHEIIAWYYPDKYPMINKNSECGMRFFGYDV